MLKPQELATISSRVRTLAADVADAANSLPDVQAVTQARAHIGKIDDRLKDLEKKDGMDIHYLSRLRRYANRLARGDHSALLAAAGTESGAVERVNRVQVGARELSQNAAGICAALITRAAQEPSSSAAPTHLSVPPTRHRRSRSAGAATGVVTTGVVTTHHVATAARESYPGSGSGAPVEPVGIAQPRAASGVGRSPQASSLRLTVPAPSSSHRRSRSADETRLPAVSATPTGRSLSPHPPYPMTAAEEVQALLYNDLTRRAAGYDVWRGPLPPRQVPELDGSERPLELTPQVARSQAPRPVELPVPERAGSRLSANTVDTRPERPRGPHGIPLPDPLLPGGAHRYRPAPGQGRGRDISR